MKESEAVEAMCQAMATAWPALQPAVPVVYDNEPFDYVETFVRVTVTHTVSNQRTMGAPGTRRFERLGNLFVSILTPIGTGRQSSALIADSVRTVYEGVDLSTPSGDRIWMMGATTREGNAEEKWAMLSVIIAFRYFDTK